MITRSPLAREDLKPSTGIDVNNRFELTAKAAPL